jgi:hypothetical protein
MTAEITFSTPKPIMIIKPDGTVHFGDHLKPDEAAKQAWDVLLAQVAAHNRNIVADLICPDCDHGLDLVRETFGDTYVCRDSLCGKVYIALPYAQQRANAALIDACELALKEIDEGVYEGDHTFQEPMRAAIAAAKETT